MLAKLGFLSDGTSPTDPAFTRQYLSNKPKCVMYLRTLSNICLSIKYNYEDSIVGSKVSIDENQLFTLYN
jgi:hypothetical protein